MTLPDVIVELEATAKRVQELADQKVLKNLLDRLTDADLGGPILDLMPHVASVVNKLVGLPLDASASPSGKECGHQAWRVTRRTGRCRSSGTPVMRRGMCSA